jgi:SulP family sulfate permease
MSAWWVPSTLRGYRVSSLGADGLAGLALVAVALPSQMATARLAGLPAVDGLYAFVAGSLLYAILGTNRHLSVGADSTIAPVLAAGVASIAAVGTAGYRAGMALAAVLVGVLLVVAGLSRLGWIAEFLSRPVITGVLAGIGVEIAVRQLPVVLGISGGGTTTIGRIRQVIDQVGHVNGWSVGIAVGTLVLVIGAQLIDRRLPGALAGLVLSIVAVDALGLASHHGVAVLGIVHGGLPSVAVPSVPWRDFRELAGPVLTVAFVCVAQTAATLRATGAATAATTDFNRDLVGVGAGNITAGLIGSFAVDASPPNSAVVTAAGARSQLSIAIAAGVVAGVVLLATAPLAHLPQATLGATLLFVSAKLFRARELRAILRFDSIEFALAMTALLAVALVGIEQGVALAIVLSLADRTRRSARPRDAILGRAPDTDHWIPTDIGRTTDQVPGILVYLVYAPLWYANADYLHLRIAQLLSAATHPVYAVVLDANAISDIDYTGLQTLRQLITELDQQHIGFAIARASHLVHHDLKHGELLHELAPEHLFASVNDAVTAMLPDEQTGTPDPLAE